MIPDDFMAAPPPYEISQQEFDTKVHIVTEASVPAPVSTIMAANGEEEEWQRWDDDSFRAAERYQQIAAESSAPGPSTSQIQPLHIKKRSGAKSSAEPSKERPSWYAEADFDSSMSSRALPTPPSSSLRQRAMPSTSPQPSVVHHTPSTEDEYPAPPPPFTIVSESTSPSPFEAVVAYHGNDSAPPSPLSSPRPPAATPESLHAVRPPPSPHAFEPSQMQADAHRPLPSSRRVTTRVGPRAPTTRPRLPPSATPHLEFDHTVAYTRSEESPKSKEVFDPKAFYNSAVSSHLPTSGPRPAQVPQSDWQEPISHQPTYNTTYAQQQPTYAPSFTPSPGFAQQPSYAQYGSVPLQQTQYPNPYLQQYAPQTDPRMNNGNMQGRWY